MRTRTLRIVTALAVAGGMAAIAACVSRPGAPARLRVAISFPESVASTPLDGRMLLLVSTDGSQEPRFQIGDNDRTQQVFGVDVEGLRPGQESVFDSTVRGYPIVSLAQVPAGEYWVQGLLHVYETFTRSDGHIVKLPPDRGEGQQWALAPGNLYSAPVRMRIDPASETLVRVSLDKKIPALPDLADTKYIKHVRIQSERLTKFWGRPMFLGAILVLPEGWESHPERAISARDLPWPFSTRGVPVARDAARSRAAGGRSARARPVLSERTRRRFCSKYGYESVLQQYGYELYKQWTGAGFPRVIMVNIQHANPYYDDSYAVNSENLGPTATRSRTSSFRTSRRRFEDSARGRAGCTAVRPADGKRSPRRCSIRTSTTARTPIARTRSISGASRTSTSTKIETRTRSKAPGAGRQGPATATISARRCPPSSR
jgi:hypothetical protein